MFSIFKKEDKAEEVPPDPIFKGVGRGVDNRPHSENWLARGYFEDPMALAKIGFRDKAGDIFLGVTQAHSEQIKRADGRTETRTTGGYPVGFLDDRHLMTIAGSRSGKGRSVIIPNLLTYGGSVLVIDPKGENAAATASYRADTLGQSVHVLDPFGITPDRIKKYRKCFNPLRNLTAKSENLTEDAAMIAEALVVPSGGETHWDETTKAFIEGLILEVVTSEYIVDRSLVTVAKLLSGKTPIQQVLSDMLNNEEADGRIIAAATAMLDRTPEEMGSILSNARKNLNFIGHKSLGDNLSGHHFNLEELAAGNTTIFLVLPATRLGTAKQWLRLFVNMTLESAQRTKRTSKYPTLMILDEFPVLGRMQELESAIGQIAGFGLRLHTIIQDISQISALYGERWETFWGNSGMIQCFGNVDYMSSAHISKYLDRTTIKVSEQSSVTAENKTFHGASGESMKETPTELLMPFEVRELFARDDKYSRQLVLIPGRRPYILQRANYDQHEYFAGRFQT